MNDALPVESISLSRRQLMNFLAGTAVAATAGYALYPLAKFFVSPKEVTEGGGILAKDRFGNPIPTSQILAEPPGTRALVAGLAGEPTDLTVQDDGALSKRGIVDNCTHLGCTFPGIPGIRNFSVLVTGLSTTQKDLLSGGLHLCR